MKTDITVNAKSAYLEVNDTEFKLYPEQALALDSIIAGWELGKASLFNVGQRGGKSTMLNTLAEMECKARPVIIVTPEGKLNNFEVYNRQLKNVYFSSYMSMDRRVVNPLSMEKELFREAIFIFDEAFWSNRTQGIVDKLRKYTHRYVIASSEGPTSQTFELDEDQGFNYAAASWDWNPTVDVSSLMPLFAQDFDKTARDFGLYNCYNMLTELTIRKRFDKTS